MIRFVKMILQRRAVARLHREIDELEARLVDIRAAMFKRRELS